MSDEFDTSVDTSDAGATEVVDDTPEEVVEEAPEEIPEDTTEDEEIVEDDTSDNDEIPEDDDADSDDIPEDEDSDEEETTDDDASDDDEIPEDNEPEGENLLEEIKEVRKEGALGYALKTMTDSKDTDSDPADSDDIPEDESSDDEADEADETDESSEGDDIPEDEDSDEEEPTDDDVLDENEIPEDIEEDEIVEEDDTGDTLLEDGLMDDGDDLSLDEDNADTEEMGSTGEDEADDVASDTSSSVCPICKQNPCVCESNDKNLNDQNDFIDKETSVDAELDNVKGADTRSAMDRMAEYLGSHNYSQADADKYMSDPEWIGLNKELKAELGVPQTAMEKMSDYMGSHNYSQDDASIYMSDPEWIGLNKELKAELGIPQTAMEKMSDYMGSHNYSRWDSRIYMNDPEWQALNEELKNEINGVTPKDVWYDQVKTNELSGVIDRDNSSFNDNENPSILDFYAGKHQNPTDLKAQLENDIMQNYDVGKADFTDFDPKVAEAVGYAIKDAKTDFPDLNINYIGSIDAQVSGIKNEIKNYYCQELAKQPGLTQEQIEQIAELNANDFIERAKMNDTSNTFAWSLNIPEHADPTAGGLSKYNGVAINKYYASDNDVFTAAKVREVATQHKPIGCDTPRATVDHELGHEIDKMLGARKDAEINRLYNEMIANGNAKDTLSGYSAKNVNEFIAECYSEYRNNPQPRDYSSQVYSRLRYLYDQRKVGK